MISDATLEVFRNSLRAHASDMPLNDAEKNALQTAFDHHAATLRQQAGRVDEGMVERACAEFYRTHWPTSSTHNDGILRDQMRAALTAALAQNTQGDEGIEIVVDSDRVMHFKESMNPRLASGKYKLYLHAERARVPEGRVLIDREALEIIANSLPLKHDTMPYAMEALGFARDEARAALAAALSQPKDAGEVGHG